MRTVRLPIFDEDGITRREELHVDVELLKAIAGWSTQWKDSVKVVPYEDPALTKILQQIDEHDMEQTPKYKSNDWVGDALSRTDRTNPWRERNKAQGLPGYPQVDDPVREEIELDFINRVMCGLPTSEIRKELQGEFPKSEEPRVDEWRTIPDFEEYEMNVHRTIVEVRTQLEVPLVDKGTMTQTRPSVLLKKDGRLAHMNLAFLFKQTFPELRK